MTWSEWVDYELKEAKEEARIEGLTEGREEGREEGRLKGDISRLSNLIFKKINKGKSLEEIADDLEEEPEDIKVLYDVVSEFASDSDFDVDKVYEEYIKERDTV